MGYLDRKDVAGFVAEFSSEGAMIKAIQRANIEIPEGWTKAVDNFIVNHDEGRVLVIQFYDYETDQRYGKEFEVGFDEVHCWA